MLLRVAGFACLGGFLYGYDLGLISGALAPIRAELHPSDMSAEVMVGAAKFGAIFGTFIGGAFMLHYGRRLAIGLDSIFFIVGPLIMAFSAGMLGLTIGRFLIGTGIGVSAVVVPAYLGEVAPAHLRGRIVEVYEVMLCLGMLSAILIDAALQHAPYNWRWMVGAPILPALVLALALVILPESPRWLVVNARLDEALAVIHRVYTDSSLPLGAQESTAEVEQELMELWSGVEKDKAAARERNQAMRQQRLLKKGWRHLRLGGTKWRNLQQLPNNQSSLDAANATRGPTTPFSTEKELVAVGVGDDGEDEKAARPLLAAQDQELSEEKTDGDPGTACVLRASQQEIELRARQASSELASTSKAKDTSFAIEATADDDHGPDCRHRSPGRSPSHSPIRRALSDPSSLLYRSLSKIPKDLPPVRTNSGLETPFNATPSPLGPARKAGLSQRLSKNRLPGPPLKFQGESGFWRVLWDMLADIKAVAKGEEKEALSTALWLAFFNQAMASSAIINYAPKLLHDSGVINETYTTLLTSTVTAAKMMGVFLGVALIDSAGRRPLLVLGSAGCTTSLILLFGGVFMESTTFEVVAMASFMLAFNSSYAGVFWVLVSEMFSMSSKAPAVSAATAMLFTAGFLADSLFLTLLKWFGPYTFLIFAAIALAGGIFSFAYVPETKGRTLAEVQALITGHGSAAYLPESSADPAPQGLASELSSQALPRDPTSEEGKMLHMGMEESHNRAAEDESALMLPTGTLKSDYRD